MFGGVVGSQPATINSLVQLTNDGLGDEVSFAWSVLDQPEGAADVLSANNIANPTLRPKKEGSYLVQLVVNAGLGATRERTDIQVLYVLDIKTLERIPAAGESLQVDLQRGWATAVNRVLTRCLGLAADPGVEVGIAGTGGLQRGMVLQCAGVVDIKSGLPGAERLRSFEKALATSDVVLRDLWILEGGVNGSSTPALNTPIRVRKHGMFRGLTVTGTETVGNFAYVSDLGFVATAAGTVSRKIGHYIDVGVATYDLQFSGFMGAT